MNKWLTKCAFLGLSVVLPALWGMDVVAFERYQDGCNATGCHGHFTDATSPKGTVFPGDNKHEMHRSSSEMATDCDLCHTSGDKKNPYIGSSNGTDINVGWGCSGCHGRLEDAGNDGAVSSGLGAGLRQHHTNAGVDDCATCHVDASPAIYIPVGEEVVPPYYGTADTNAAEPLNLIPQARTNENWTVGDFIGLDNDGDLSYDAQDVSNAAPIADPGGPYSAAADEVITFDGSGSSDSDGTIVSYDWDFGDGGTATGVSPTHAYTTTEDYKRYTVRLTVTDDDGFTDTMTTIAVIGSISASTPPVNQTIGTLDAAPSVMVEGDCRACHDSGVPDRHHALYGSERGGVTPPYPDPGGGTTWTCVNCHSENFTVERDCVVCHTGSAHHSTPTAQAGDCVSCHGDLVDNMDDGHYIPTYAPSLVTPYRSGGTDEPLNSRGEGAGACDYCHDNDDLNPNVVLTNEELHHNTGFFADQTKCVWCHDFDLPFNEQIRVCEGCHGPDSLHNIQADTPKPANIGTIVIGGEDSGYGHVGRDAGPGDSDCWGCHSFPLALEAAAAAAPAAPLSGPIIPTVYTSDRAIVNAGTDTVVILSGSAFTNVAGSTLFESEVALTDASGSPILLTPNAVTEWELAVTIPGDTPPGNYNLQAVKDEFASNPTVISVVPQVIITEATLRGSLPTIEIQGSGFGGYAEGSGTSVIATVVEGGTITTVEATILSWSDTAILAVLNNDTPTEITVNSIFGSATAEASKPGKGKGRGE